MKLDHLNVSTNMKNNGFSMSDGISSICDNFVVLSSISECLTQVKKYTERIGLLFTMMNSQKRSLKIILPLMSRL